jgi:Short-chain dehydrogenases of various substrate specificities
MSDLTGLKALITGAGAHVTIADLNGEAAAAIAAELGGESWQVDLSQTAALAQLSLDCDILVNNAGIQHVSPIEQFDPERFSFIIRLMLEAPFLLIRAALPHMYERGFGRIINLPSVHGLRASAYKSAYVTAKHGLEGLSKVTALEGGPHGVTSNCINPASVRTPSLPLVPQLRLHEIEDVNHYTIVMAPEGADQAAPVIRSALAATPREVPAQ